MKKLKKVGYFRELPYGDKENGPSLKENILETPHEHEANIIKYIESGIGFVAAPGIVYDVFTNEQIGLGPEVLTDGTWEWYQELSYYIKIYHVKLPDEFIEHMIKNDWKVPDESEVDLLNLE